jgi:hexosaminidase
VSIRLPVKLRIETDIVNGSRVWVDDTFVGRFEVFVFGGRNTLFSWSQMALVAPLDRIEGGIDSLVLEAGVESSTSRMSNVSHDQPPVESSVDRLEGLGAVSLLAIISMAMLCL